MSAAAADDAVPPPGDRVRPLGSAVAVVAGTTSGPAAWLVVRGTQVPARWQDRAFEGFVIQLTPSELDQVLGGGRADPVLSPMEERIAALLASGAPQTQIASAFGLSLRTVQRRVGLLRRRLNVDSTYELQQQLRAMGF